MTITSRLLRTLLLIGSICGSAVHAEFVGLFSFNDAGDVIDVLDLSDGTSLYSFDAPVSFSSRVGLAHGGTSLFYGGFGTSNTIFELDVADGTVLNSFTPSVTMSSSVSQLTLTLGVFLLRWDRALSCCNLIPIVVVSRGA